MNTFFSKFKKEAEHIRLTSRERESLRRVLEAEMRGLEKSPVRVTPSPLLFFSHRLVSSFALILVVAVLGSTTAYAAEGAVPGDALYPIKVGVNERIATALAVSSEGRAGIHTRLAERRMEEAQVLAARGTLTEGVKAELASNFEIHAVEVEAVVSEIEEHDPIVAAHISARFSSSVEARAAVIARLVEEDEEGESKREASQLSMDLRDRSFRLAQGGAPLALKAESRTVTSAAPAQEDSVMTLSAVLPLPDADEAVAARIELTASTTLEEAETYLAALKDRFGATTSARTKQQIERIREFIKKLRENGDIVPVKEKAERALKDAATIKAFIEAQEKFEDHTLLPAPDLDGGDDERDEESEWNNDGEKDNEDQEDEDSDAPGNSERSEGED